MHAFTTAIPRDSWVTVRVSRLSPGASRSPRPDGLDREAGLLESANASDGSTEEERAGASLAMATSRAEEPEAEAEADSCGYEGDTGEGNKRLSPSSRRGCVVSRPGFPTERVR